MGTAATFSNFRLAEAASADQAAGFLITLGEIVDLAPMVSPDLRADVVRAFSLISIDPQSLIRDTCVGEFWSNGTTHPEMRNISFAHLLPPLIGKLGFSSNELASIRDLSLAGAADESLARAVARDGLTGNYAVDRVASGLAWTAVTAATLFNRQSAAESSATEDLGSLRP